jgi:hypothetical protein
MFKRSLVALAAVFSVANASALTAGDIAFTSYNADEDGWALVALADITANTTIFFSDNEYTNAGWNDTNESALQWQTGASTIAAGTVVRFSKIDSATRAATLGSLVNGNLGTNFGFSNSAETVYAYLGTDAASPTQFLTALVAESGGATLLNGTGLSLGSNAVQITTSADFAEYTGSRTGLASFADYKPLVFNGANWAVDTGGDHAADTPNLSAFSITASAVPEPGSYALTFAGLFAAALLMRARQGV